MGAGFEEDKRGIFHKNCSNLLELASADDLAGFIHEIEEKGSDINEVSFWYGRSFGSFRKMGFEERTPIMIASLYGSTGVLKYMIGTHKVDVNRACGSDGATALHCAVAGGSWSSVDTIKILMDASADTNSVDVNGKRPSDLIASCVTLASNSKKKILEMLLNGISLEAVSQDDDENERSKTKKEYPVDISMPDINNGIYGTDEFRMYSFKVKPCSRAYSHDWTECPFVHPGENARRRDPRKYHYTCVPCPEFKKGSCCKGDSCEYAHGIFESWLHPAQYRTRICKDETGCVRKVCFFAHKPEELRPLYASTGSGMPSPKSVSINNLLDMTTTISPSSLGSPSLMISNTSTPPMSPSITCSSPMGGGGMWQNNKANLMPPALQLPGSRLKTAFSARNMDLDMELQQRRQLIDEMASLSVSSPYRRFGDLNPTNLDDIFGCQSPNEIQIRQNMSQIRASYPSNVSSSSSRKSPAAYGFDSSAAVAAAVMNSRSAAFSKRSQSFIDRGRSVGYGSGLSGPTTNSLSKLSEWGSSDGKLEWGFSGEELNKLRKSASFGYRSGNGSTAAVASGVVGEPDVSWVNSLVKDVPVGSGGGGAGLNGVEQGQGLFCETMPHWLDQMYIEQEQIVA